MGELNPVLSFYETGNGASMANAMYGRPVYGKRQASMLQGYAKSEFRNFGEFVRLGMKDETKFNQIHATPQFWAARNGLVARSTGRSLAAR